MIFIPSRYFDAKIARRTDTDESVFVNVEIHTSALETTKSFFKTIATILKNKVYLFSALGLSTLYFIITAVQYWATDYMIDVLGEKDRSKVILCFSVICISSPTLGVLVGGLVSGRLGGYESKDSVLFCLIAATISALFSIVTPLCDSVIHFTVSLWIVLFFGGMVVPPTIGILISSLSSELRGSANSVTSITSSLFGYLPAPFFYGAIYNHTKEYHKKMAFSIVMYYSFVGVIFISFTTYFKFQEIEEAETKYHQKNISECGNGRISARNMIGPFNNTRNFAIKYSDADLGAEEIKYHSNISNEVRNANPNNIILNKSIEEKESLL